MTQYSAEKDKCYLFDPHSAFLLFVSFHCIADDLTEFF